MIRRAPKDSKFLRIKLDVVLEWPKPGPLQMAGPKDFREIVSAVANAAQKHGAVAVRESSISFGCDNRKRDEKGGLIK